MTGSQPIPESGSRGVQDRDAVGIGRLRHRPPVPPEKRNDERVRILLTGHAGLAGTAIWRLLTASGFDVRGFDLADGDDLLDRRAVERAAAGCGAVVHAAAVNSDHAGTPERIQAVNVLGTWHVLQAAVRAGISRVVYFSSVQVFGIGDGEQPPGYLPVDDDHPRNASRPYGLSKCQAEDLCAGVSATSGITTVCLRPVAIWTAQQYHEVTRRREADRASEWQPFWEFGAFVDVRDVAGAVLAALRSPERGHLRATLCAPDISATAPAREMAGRLLPGVPWRGGAEYDTDPWTALVRGRAGEVLGWKPEYTWRRWLAGTTA
jgi:UDP-glucose 4-epimerase